MKIAVQGLLLLLSIETVTSFSVVPHHETPRSICQNAARTERSNISRRPTSLLFSTPEEGEPVVEDKEELKEKVGNLVADDEWMGLSMELSELVRVSIIEETKKNARDFLGKEDYKVGDISKEIDTRVKNTVADFRGKENYELGDLTMALDELSKQVTCELTGKEDYETGDLSKEVDRRVKNAVAEFCGKESGDDYEFGDLSKEMDRRIQDRVAEFTGNDEYSFGDISREVEQRRKAWVTDFLGQEAAENYQFGDITKKALANLAGKDDGEDYQFGDVTKKLMGDLFGPRKRGGDGK